ncbi:MAG: DEAD/DEAH box helicase [Candidatus Micrarchaeia archaeon]
MTKKFEELGLNAQLLLALREEGYTEPTPIQEQTIPLVLEGRDVIGCAQTGTGKTAAFACPIIQRLSEKKRAASRWGTRCLVLTPTRELAAQIADSFHAYGRHARLKLTVAFGGVGQHPQVNALSKGVDVLIATPGRLLDLMEQGYARFEDVDVFVLDEADRMLDMGFIRDVERIIRALPARRQSLFFSATMSPEVIRLARGILSNPAEVSVAPSATTVELVNQQVYFVSRDDKFALLKKVLTGEDVGKALVFARTKHGADRISRQLNRENVPADAIHGNKSQGARTLALDNFRSGRSRVIIATDLAARGIDVEGITHVINYELPHEPGTYIHRIGRTARAGASGAALSFCDLDETIYLHDIEHLIRQHIPVVEEHALHSEEAHAAKRELEAGRMPRGINPPHKRSGHGSRRPQQTHGRPPQRGHAPQRGRGGFQKRRY